PGPGRSTVAPDPAAVARRGRCDAPDHRSGRIGPRRGPADQPAGRADFVGGRRARPRVRPERRAADERDARSDARCAGRDEWTTPGTDRRADAGRDLLGDGQYRPATGRRRGPGVGTLTARAAAGRRLQPRPLADHRARREPATAGPGPLDLRL